MLGEENDATLSTPAAATRSPPGPSSRGFRSCLADGYFAETQRATCTNGALIPFLLTWLGVDPASAMGPFVTTLNDILGLAIYFLIATALYL